MEFTEDAKANAAKFLKEFSKSGPPEGEALPVRSHWSSLFEEEVEGECLDMARTYLARK